MINENKNVTFNAMKPLIRVLKIFCLNCHSTATTVQSLVIFKMIISISIFGLLHFSSLYYKILHLYIIFAPSVVVMDVIQIFYDDSLYIVDLFFVYKYGRHITSQYFKHYEIIDRILGVTEASRMRKKIICYMGFFMTIWIVSSGCDFVVWIVGYGILLPLSHSMLYVFLSIKMLTILDLIANASHIAYRLNILGQIVKLCHCDMKPIANGPIVDCISNNKWLYANKKEKTTIFGYKSYKYEYPYEIKQLTNCYLLLTEQVNFINKMYGVRVLLLVLGLLIEMVKLTNFTLMLLIGSQKVSAEVSVYPAISTTMRLMTCVAIIISLVSECERSYHERDTIVNILDHLLVNKNPDVDLRKRIVDLRTLIRERPIYFNMAHFFTLNYSLLVTMASVVITYTIILLQNGN